MNKSIVFLVAGCVVLFFGIIMIIDWKRTFGKTIPVSLLEVYGLAGMGIIYLILSLVFYIW